MRICGFCMTKHHDNCKKEIKYYDKVWVCECNVCVEIENESKEGQPTPPND